MFPLQKTTSEDDTDQREAYQVDATLENGAEVSIAWNMCAHTFNTCADQVKDYAHFMGTGQTSSTCVHLSQEVDDGEMRLLDRERPELGVVLEYRGNSKCTDTLSYGLVIRVECNRDVYRTKYMLDIEATQKSPCTPQIIMESPSGCS